MNTSSNLDVVVYIGRFCPVHRGHENIICKMLSMYGVDRSLLIIGSANRARSFGYMFTADERKMLLDKICPSIPKRFMDDLYDNNVWIKMLYSTICDHFKTDKLNITFFGGSEGDVWYLDLFKTLLNIDIKMYLIDRNGLPISATNVRMNLLNGESIHGLVNAMIEAEILYYFNKLNIGEVKEL